MSGRAPIVVNVVALVVAAAVVVALVLGVVLTSGGAVPTAADRLSRLSVTAREAEEVLPDRSDLEALVRSTAGGTRSYSSGYDLEPDIVPASVPDDDCRRIIWWRSLAATRTGSAVNEVVVPDGPLDVRATADRFAGPTAAAAALQALIVGHRGCPVVRYRTIRTTSEYEYRATAKPFTTAAGIPGLRVRATLAYDTDGTRTTQEITSTHYRVGDTLFTYAVRRGAERPAARALVGADGFQADLDRLVRARLGTEGGRRA